MTEYELADAIDSITRQYLTLRYEPSDKDLSAFRDRVRDFKPGAV